VEWWPVEGVIYDMMGMIMLTDDEGMAVETVISVEITEYGRLLELGCEATTPRFPDVTDGTLCSSVHG